jgi:iron complex transport system substrate-binding protein
MTPMRPLRVLLCAAVLCHATCVAAVVSAVDDSGHTITLPSPATRIISLAPHATELLFAAGAGTALVGVSEFSDYPEAAKRIPSVGSSMQLDLERIVALKPDLVIAWKSGNNARQLSRLRALGLTVFDSEPRSFDDIASSLERLGALAGSNEGRSQATKFRLTVKTLRQRYTKRSPVTVFYQIWPAPLMTLNDRHFVSEAIRLCGGVNVFGTLPSVAPTISREAVVKADPDVIFISDERQEAIDRWRDFTRMKAVKHGTLFRIDGGAMNRPGPRLADASITLCERIDQARSHNQSEK